MPILTDTIRSKTRLRHLRKGNERHNVAHREAIGTKLLGRHLRHFENLP